MCVGDSTTVGQGAGDGTQAYRPDLISGLMGTGNWASVGFTQNLSQSGWNTNDVRLALPNFYNTQTTTQDPAWILISLGLNDVPVLNQGSLTQAQWKSQMGEVLDSLHNRWPYAQIRLLRIYQPAYPTEQNLVDDVLIPQVLVGRQNFAAIGPDSRTFLPGHLADPPHPDASGYALIASNWQTNMGY